MTKESNTFERAAEPDACKSIMTTPFLSSTTTVWFWTIISFLPFLSVTSTRPSFNEATILPPTSPTKPAVPRMAATAVPVLNSKASPIFCFWTSKCIRPFLMTIDTLRRNASNISAERVTSEFSVIHRQEPSSTARTTSDSKAVRMRSFSIIRWPTLTCFQFNTSPRV